MGRTARIRCSDPTRRRQQRTPHGLGRRGERSPRWFSAPHVGSFADARGHALERPTVGWSRCPHTLVAARTERLVTEFHVPNRASDTVGDSSAPLGTPLRYRRLGGSVTIGRPLCGRRGVTEASRNAGWTAPAPPLPRARRDEERGRFGVGADRIPEPIIPKTTAIIT
jgi:hypothetical protein